MTYGRWIQVGLLLLAGVVAGCGSSNETISEPFLPPSRYPTLPKAQLPPSFKDTIMERAVLANTDPFMVGGFGLVVNLAGTGDSTAPTPVRDYIINEMTKHRIGSPSLGTSRLQPEEILKDKRVAIAEVTAFIPPGARKMQRLDVRVSALNTSYTSSLARGQLYRTDLRIAGNNPTNPAGSVNVFVRAEGPIFVNPGYILSKPTTQPNVAVASLRNGLIMDGGVVAEDRPIHVRVRQPEYRMTRLIQYRIVQRFQDNTMAAAMDDGIVNVFVPASYRRDWQHFSQVVMHLYMNASPEFAVLKAKELAQEAVKPNAPLRDISFAWEGLDRPALPYILPLMTHGSADVAFAAARAAAYIGDASAQTVLLEMAHKKNHPFQLAAVQVLGDLPSTPMLNQMLRQLVESDQTTVRLEAYRVLAANRDSIVYSRVVREKFILDIVPGKGKPLVYASRWGLPRIAVIGDRLSVRLPLTFRALNDNLLIVDDTRKHLKMVYAGPDVRQAVAVLSNPDLAEIVARLGGEGPKDEPRMDFTYGDVVAIVSALCDSGKVFASGSGHAYPAPFVLQETSVSEDAIRGVPAIPDAGRPQADKPPAVGRGQ